MHIELDMIRVLLILVFNQLLSRSSNFLSQRIDIPSISNEWLDTLAASTLLEKKAQIHLWKKENDIYEKHIPLTFSFEIRFIQASHQI